MSSPAVRLDDVRVITNDVWLSFLDAHEPLEWSPVPMAEPEVVRAAVDIRGAWDGTVTLEMSPAAALTATRTMVGADDVADADVLDALGELVNMIGGNFKSLLPSGCALGLPKVLTTTVPANAPVGTTELCRVDLTWIGTTVLVRVCSHRTEKEDTPT